MKIIIYLIVIFSLSTSNLFAQNNDTEAIKAVINKLFEGMHNCDSAMVSSVFHPKAALNSIGFSEKSQQNYFTSDNRIKSFLEVIAKPKTILWDEKATSFEIKIDGPMAEAWVPYTFHLGDKFSHCGVDNFVLFKEDFLSKSSLNNQSNTQVQSDFLSKSSLNNQSNTQVQSDFLSKSSINNSTSNTKKSVVVANGWKIIYLVDTMRKDNCVK